MQDKIALSDQLVLQAGSHTCGRFSFRMRIENWELNIGQILPSLHSAKLFFSEPSAPRCGWRKLALQPRCKLGKKLIGPPPDRRRSERRQLTHYFNRSVHAQLRSRWLVPLQLCPERARKSVLSVAPDPTGIGRIGGKILDTGN